MHMQFDIAFLQKKCIGFEINSNVYLIYTFEKSNEKKIAANEEVFLQKNAIHLRDALQLRAKCQEKLKLHVNSAHICTCFHLFLP